MNLLIKLVREDVSKYLFDISHLELSGFRQDTDRLSSKIIIKSEYQITKGEICLVFLKLIKRIDIVKS